MDQARVTEKPSLTLRREYPVAPDKVWRAWTDPEAIKRWFGPGGCDPVSLAELDLRVGGRFRIVFGGADGKAHECTGVYRVVEPFRRLAFTWIWPRTTPQRESLVTIEFRQSAHGTELAFRHEQLFDEKVRDDHERGWSESFVKLERYLQGLTGLWQPAMRPFVAERVFDAPLERVWKSWTEPERLRRWWGPQGFKVHTCKVDLRPGGMFLYGMTAPDGSEMWGRFVYREIALEQRLVFIVSFSDAQGGVTRHPWNENWPLETHSTVTFQAQGNKTMVRVRWIPHDSAGELERKTFDEGRQSMKQGWGGTLDQFASYLART